MVIGINFIIAILGFILYFKKAIYAPFFYLIWCTLLAYIIDLIIPIRDYNDSYYFDRIALVYIWICGIVHVIRNLKFYLKRERVPLVTIILFLSYIVYLGFSRGTLVSFTGLMRLYLCFVPLWLILLKEKFNQSKYEKYLFFALLIEIVLALLQYFAGIGYSSFVDRFAENDAENITGTFRRYNAFSENVSLLILSLLSLKFLKKNDLKPIIFIMCLIGYYLVFLAGARTEFVALSLGLLCLCIVRYKEHLVKILFVGAILFIVYISNHGINFDSLGEVEQADNNIERQMQVFNSLSNDEYLAEKSTLFLSVFLLNEYAESGQYLTGPGYLYKSKSGYGDVVSVDGAMSDSDLALYLCETGIVGISFLFFVLYLIVKRCSNIFYAIILCVYLLIISVTDYGLFEGVSSIYMLLSIESINTYMNESETSDRICVSMLKSPVNLVY